MIKESEKNISSRLKKVEEKFTGINNKLREEVEDIKKEVSALKAQKLRLMELREERVFVR